MRQSRNKHTFKIIINSKDRYSSLKWLPGILWNSISLCHRSASFWVSLVLDRIPLHCALQLQRVYVQTVCSSWIEGIRRALSVVKTLVISLCVLFSFRVNWCSLRYAILSSGTVYSNLFLTERDRRFTTLFDDSSHSIMFLFKLNKHT